MSKSHGGRTAPESWPAPGTRAEQRDTDEQLATAAGHGDPATAWEREEQEKLPPRGAGNQHNQGEDKGPALHESGDVRIASPADEEAGAGASARATAAAGTPAAEFHSGGTRGPSNDNRG
jgi:hypothetical protein